MDPLFRMVSGLRAHGLFSLRISMVPPWSVDIDDGAPLSVIAVDRGAAWITAAGTRIRLDAGAVALVAMLSASSAGDELGSALRLSWWFS